MSFEKNIHSVYPKYPSDKPQQFINKDGKRHDGRSVSQLRNIFMKTGVVSVARGSAYIELNNTKVICSVYGPRQITSEFSDKGRINCELQMTNFCSKGTRKDSFKTRDISREYSIRMREALEVCVMLDKIPKSVIDIFCLVIEDDGSCLSAAITAASLALADAGVEMYDLVSACSASEVEDHIVIDSTALEEKYATGGVICAYMSKLEEITQLVQTGDMKYEKVAEAIELCIDGCTKIQEIMASTLQKK